MEGKELISIIVPIYNTEKYLKNCLDSIDNQTYQNIEVILVDDGSTDKSPIICDEYCKEHNKFKVIHKKNNGVSSAKNCGIEKSNGKYVLFVDSDDKLSNMMIELLYNNIIKYDADISMCNIVRIDESGKLIKKYKDKNEKERIDIMNKTQYVSKILDDKYYFTFPYNKLIRKSIIKNVRFRENIYYNEDGIFCLDLADNINKAVYIGPVEYYFHIRNKGSVTEQKFNDKWMTILDSYKIMEKYFDIFDEKNKSYFAYRYFCDCYKACKFLKSQKREYNDRKKELINVKKKYRKYIFKPDNVSILGKAKLLIKYISASIIF